VPVFAGHDEVVAHGDADGAVVGVVEARSKAVPGEHHVRPVLAQQADEKTRESFQHFFKEKVTFYGVKTNLVEEIARKYLREIKPLGKPEIFRLCEELLKSDYSEEAAIACETMGNRVERIYDCGVAGLHRLVPHLDRLNEANAIVVVAGMEGALPSVVGGLVDRPVIAVPTSVGYGASFGGIAALLAMLNSCAPGVSVVNIDNGYGAAAQANQINKLAAKVR